MKNGTEITPLEPDPDHAGVGKTVTAQCAHLGFAFLRFRATFPNRQPVECGIFILRGEE